MTPPNYTPFLCHFWQYFASSYPSLWKGKAFKDGDFLIHLCSIRPTFSVISFTWLWYKCWRQNIPDAFKVLTLMIPLLPSGSPSFQPFCYHSATRTQLPFAHLSYFLMREHNGWLRPPRDSRQFLRTSWLSQLGKDDGTGQGQGYC